MGKDIHITIPDPAAWYYHAAIMAFFPGDPKNLSVRTTMTEQGLKHLDITGLAGVVTIARTEEATRITIAPAEGTANDWYTMAARLRSFADEAREKRHMMDGLTADEMIERYYRSRAAGSKITLKQVAAEQRKYSYGYLREIKRQYDAAGKWGSKKELSGRDDKKSGE